MTHADALIQLVRSLTKNEKRSFRLGKKSGSDYIVLFDLIDKDEILSVEELREAFEKRQKGSVFNVTVTYLYKLLLDKLIILRQNQDVNYSLIMKILKAKILFEKSVFPAALDMLESVKDEASEVEHDEAKILASRLELDYLQYLNMPSVSEIDLIHRQYDLRASLKKLTNLYEQSALYELLRHRLIYKGVIRSAEDMSTLNDLIVSEQAIAQKSSNSVAAQKRHLLFQSMFLMAIGDELSASDVLVELNDLTADSPMTDSPMFYVSILENFLANLRETGRYQQMPEVIEKIKGLSHSSKSVTQYFEAVMALYQFLPMLDHGEFQKAKDFLERTPALQPDAIDKLDPSFESKVSLYISLMYLGLRDYRKARRTLVSSIMHRSGDLPIHRIMRITNLIIHHKMGDIDYIMAESRSIKREIAKNNKGYKMELLILEVVGKGSYGLMGTKKREQMWDKIKPRLDEIRKDVFESQLLKIFDFSAWVEAEILRKSFGEILLRNLNESA